MSQEHAIVKAREGSGFHQSVGGEADEKTN